MCPLTLMEHPALCVKEILAKTNSAVRKQETKIIRAFSLEYKIPRNTLYFKILTLNFIR